MIRHIEEQAVVATLSGRIGELVFPVWVREGTCDGDGLGRALCRYGSQVVIRPVDLAGESDDDTGVSSLDT